MKIKKIFTALCVCFCAVLLAGCSSRLSEQAGIYVSEVTGIIKTAMTSSQKIKEIEEGIEEEDVNTLSKPENFTVSEDGSFSFDAVENAVAYYVYIYENSTTKDAHAKMEITDDGSASYQGNVSDILAAGATTDWMGNIQEPDPLSYGLWSIRVAAIPDYENTDYAASKEAKCDYLISGAVEVGNPEFNYMWSVFGDELTINIAGLDYGRTAYPILISLTLTNEADPSDVVVVDLTGISGSSVDAVTTDATLDATYSIEAYFEWDSEYVTNPQYTFDGGEAKTSSTDNLISGEFYYVDSTVYSGFGFPHVQLDFDPAAGGLAGVWYKDPSSQNNTMMMPGMDSSGGDESTDSNAYFEATPKDPENGALYSYDLVITSPAGKIYALPYTDSGKGTTIIWGSMDIFDDGTFRVEIEYQYILTDTISSGVFYVPGSICNGSYTKNADGTLNLSYDHTNCYESDFEIITELTGHAAEYAKDHPDFVQTFSNPFG